MIYSDDPCHVTRNRLLKDRWQGEELLGVDWLRQRAVIHY